MQRRIYDEKKESQSVTWHGRGRKRESNKDREKWREN